ncbi:NAD(P)-binding protein [Teratosphaeria nubilosa]|uniref:NAD(P)-binding protein n=1 Tax=Teratosphaeria nubilosa TaxID=161662 RepID=A0A6G1L320_9PEZI|nr:NAD(P)-binding protein [Teratosphaeria nubilosa]
MTADFPTYPDLTGKVALITGIGQVGLPNSKTWGNGAATARVLSYNGVKIYGCDLHLKAAEYTQQRLLKDTPQAVVDVVTTDVTNTADVSKFVEAALTKHGRIDVLINNVGMTTPGDPGTMEEAAWLKQIDLNLHSVFRLPQMAYASAKAAVIQFTKAAGCMYASKGIRLNAVVPGLMFTPLVETLGASDKEEDREVFRKITEHNVPMGVMGESIDVANAAVFLCSNAAKYMTAHALVVDGGITAATGTGG